MSPAQSDSERDQAIERWFIGRGVPHFIEGYTAATDIWTRSIPLLVIAYVAGGLNALDIEHWSLGKNLLAACLVVGILVVCWAITNVSRNRPVFDRPTALGPPELAAFIIGPAIPSLIFAQWGDAFQAVWEGLAVLAAIYLVTSYGVWALLTWAARRSVAQIASLAGLVVRALPLLLLFTTFLFISAEVWQVAGTLTGPPYIATLSIFFLLGTVFVLSQLPGLMTGLATFENWADIHELLEGTPAAGGTAPTFGSPPPYPLTRRQRANVGLVSVFSQALQITFVGVLLTAFFVLFGLLAMPTEIQESWTTLERVHVLATWHTGGRDLVITEPLLRVAGFLGAFTSMYFTVVLSTDATYRDAFADDVAPQVRQALAVRAAYRWSKAGVVS